MSCISSVLTLLMIAGCEVGGTPAEAISTAIANEQRLEADRAADERRKPAAVLGFFEVEAGETVLDLFAGGGYYTEILSHLVGTEGQVISHNNQAYLDYVAEPLAQRFTPGRLANVTRLTAEASELDLAENSIDTTLMILTYHDFYYVDPENGWPAIDRAHLFGVLCRAMKPGAILGVVDHVAATGSGSSSAQTLHRIEPSLVRRELVEESCFDFVAESNDLRNSADDPSKSMGDPSVRGQTDRFIYKFRRR